MLPCCLVVAACGRSAPRPGDVWLEAGGAGAAGADGPDFSGSGPGNGGSSGRGNAGGSAGRGGTSEPSGGEPSAAGTPNSGGGNGGEGVAGEGGAPDGPQPAPFCDDGNPCTIDSFVGDGCRHTAAPDEQPCDDGKLCTLGDRCASGVCVAGALQSGAAHALGNVETYGLGLAAAPGDGRFVFVDVLGSQVRVTAAAVDGATLYKRGQADVDRSLTTQVITAAWDDLVVVADGTTSFGLNAPSRYMQLFSSEADGSLTAHAAVPLTPGATSIPANTSLTGR
ncbi:MAG TPA: hypothetical protein VEQ58_06980, partial [Polyangiaceae bacterium]|nr:hypothetical protein [Polyangiaceae bacterium]